MTVYASLLGAEAAKQIHRMNPKVVVGDVAYREHPQEKIRTVWWMIADEWLCDAAVWVPLGYAEFGEFGRFIIHDAWFPAYCNALDDRTPNHAGYAMAPYALTENRADIPDTYKECAMGGLEVGPVWGAGTVLEPRGIIPKRVFDWVVCGELLPEYRPTYLRFPHASPEYKALRAVTYITLSDTPHRSTNLQHVFTAGRNGARGVVHYQKMLDASYVGIARLNSTAALRHVLITQRANLLHG